MRQKLLLLLLLVPFGALFAQSDTIRSVVFSEARYDRADMVYIELTNMGTEAVNLSEFELLSHHPWTPFPDGRMWPTEPHRVDRRWLFLPDQMLGPGESYVLSAFQDWTEEQYAIDVALFGYSQDHPSHVTKPELKKLTDLPVHRPESPTGDPTDSISVYDQLFDTWGGRDVIYLRHHPPGADSCVVDQVNGTFTDADGSNSASGRTDVAGVADASNVTTLVRRFIVKEGNLTFVTGNDLSESEWMPIPHLNDAGGYEPHRAVFWTVGNHGAYNLDEATLTSSTIDIDWTDHILTVPWGVRNDDSIMYQFNRVPGLAWHYKYSTDEDASADSAYVSVRTGDTLTVYACGDDLDVIKWHIEAAAPTADANWVIPMRRRNPANNEFPNNGAVFAVSHMVPGMDTISEIPFGTRVDTLYKYLEKAPLADWEIVWVDGAERTDLKFGDKLKVTAEDGSVKEYFLKLRKYRPSRNAYLSAITWPDIPDDYRGIFGWTGDTIPEFNRTKQSYIVTVPFDVNGIPALVAKNEDDNARHVVKRAKTLTGSVADKTVTITSTAENDTTILNYSIVLEKEKNLDDVQPWLTAEPFISQYTFKENYSNTMIEIVNPGNQEMDLSDYMIFTGQENDPANAIAGFGDWEHRYQKYIPGYKWQDTVNWAVQRSIAVQDINVNPIVYPGDVFVLAEINNGLEDPYRYRNQIDIDFRALPWGEEYGGRTAVYDWVNVNTYLWKILNDSIKLGLKPADDPADFMLIETFGMGDGTAFAPVGPSTAGNQVTSYTRKPEIWHGETEFQASFGGTVDSSQWTYIDENVLQTRGYGWPNWRTEVPEGTGSHFMNEATIYKSTVAGLDYLVSSGYSWSEEIRGVVTGTTVEGVLGGIVPADTGQRFKVIAVADGSMLDMTDVVMNGDTLVVTSADSANVSKYILNVTDGGLSDDAVLTSTTYTVTVDGATGTIEGMEYGTLLKAVADGVVVPAGAHMTIVDPDDNYVPFRRLNFDTVYVDVMVTDMIYFEVVAEDGATKILYQLKPTASASDAFVLSDVFDVDQTSLLIGLVPQGTNVNSFFAKLVAAPGASLMLIDKLGFERASGTVVLDDKLVVTAADGVTTRTYYLTLLDEVANYLAYVVSDIYVVDQDELTITGVLGTQTAADFKGNVTPAEQATMEVQNSGGAAKVDADMMADDDMLQVTAGNGVNVVHYTIALDHTAIRDLTGDQIQVYPNPSTGQLNIAGAGIGNRIRVYNAVGVAVRDVTVNSGIERISLDDQPGGMYFITIRDNEEVVGHYKVIKQ